MRKILICDDDINIRKALKAVFNPQLYQVDEFESGNLAVDALRKTDYDVVLMDIDMPDINGIETITKMKEIKANLNVIVVTGHKLSDVMAVGYQQLNVYDIVEKPFDVEYLRHIVEESISVNS